MIEILNWKRKLAQTYNPQTADLKEIVRNQKAALQRLNNSNKLWELMVGLADGSLPHKNDAKSLNEKVLLYHLLYRNELRYQRSGKTISV